MSSERLRSRNSNVHVGERHWGTDPTEDADTPVPGLTVEVDFHNRSTQSLWTRTGSDDDLTSEWTDRIEDNYALYGVDVELQPDEVIDDSELPDHVATLPTPVAAPFTVPELGTVEEQYHDTAATQYLFVANNSESEFLGSVQTGANFYLLGGELPESVSPDVNPEGVAVFAENHPHDLARRKTAVHEIAHSFQIGEADDDCAKRPSSAGEIYSGEANTNGPTDSTPESMDSFARWSIMAEGCVSGKMTSTPMTLDGRGRTGRTPL